MSTKPNKREGPTQGPRPGYFIIRKSGEVVPLVAVDELPLGVDLIGVPRSLNLVETGGMMNLGLQGGEGKFYGLQGLEEEDDEDVEGHEGRDAVEVGSSGSDTTASSPLLLPRRSSTTSTPTSAHPKTQPPKPKSSLGLSTSIHAPSSLANTRMNQSTAPTLGGQQAQRQTCRHWCTHNRRCKWGENCHYKHEMPRTRFELGLIGLSDWPGWFKAENLGFFPGFVNRRGLETLGNVDLGGGMERKERDRERGTVVREGKDMETGMGMGILEGERVLERLREMEKLLRAKGVVAGKIREKDEKKTEGKLRDEKKNKEREKEKIKEREREERLEIRRAEAKKERERLRNEKIREKEVAGRIDRGDVEGARKWADESDDVSEDEAKGDGKNEKGAEKGEKIRSASGEKEKLVDV
ncbi:hypothetical protein NHQ30_006968 [Ciborinia camelliae]|nr:hypothetical protein NHQ30_006968 [Ciborinia camelliae]